MFKPSFKMYEFKIESKVEYLCREFSSYPDPCRLLLCHQLSCGLRFKTGLTLVFSKTKPYYILNMTVSSEAAAQWLQYKSTGCHLELIVSGV